MARRSRQPDASPTQEPTQEPPTQESSATMRGEGSVSSRPQGQEEDRAQYKEIPVAQGEFRLKRKREYLAALSRGVQPSLNPFEFDDYTTSPDPETLTRH
jgi:hypothetical protein